MRGGVDRMCSGWPELSSSVFLSLTALLPRTAKFSLATRVKTWYNFRRRRAMFAGAVCGSVGLGCVHRCVAFRSNEIFTLSKLRSNGHFPSKPEKRAENRARTLKKRERERETEANGGMRVNSDNLYTSLLLMAQSSYIRELKQWVISGIHISKNFDRYFFHLLTTFLEKNLGKSDKTTGIERRISTKQLPRYGKQISTRYVMCTIYILVYRSIEITMMHSP